MKKAATLIALALGALSLSACSAPTENTEGLSIVATTTQVTEFTSTIVGSEGTVTGLIQPNQSAHSFDPSAKQLLQLSQADAVVMNGADLEPWLQDALDAANFSGEIIDASTGIELLAAGESEEDHAGHAEDEHNHGEGDPHVWTSPANAEVMVSNIAAGLSALPEVTDQMKASFEANATSYNQQLTILDEWIVANFAQVPETQRLLVTNHDAFTYFVHAYGITFLGSIIPSFDDNAEPSAAELDALIALIEESGASAVFSESSISPKLAETIATEAGVKVYSGDDALYSDSLGVAGSAGETYIKATIHNVTKLMEAWGYLVLPVPAELTS
ncbi:metal ABC transporter substrate-binding protein [Aurantimicrobium sp. MWH-Uga1]|uniref:metal ABC transporter substrate-binding protein n=1 Tax=Aurantimicrobium sp. MWH-Uga1 TaxID=2079575 RepID=UPI000DED4356|nr:metal ABC transporter substrate-binding protein [Aurantimicrobium sp. MWH-Uga1]AXE53760.1 putative periplasmic iron-binding protein precursor [Aurantimicrobium sp. MWH-Uga1]